MNCSDHSAKGNDVHRLLPRRSVEIRPSLSKHAKNFTHLTTGPHVNSGLIKREPVILERRPGNAVNLVAKCPS
jgi:hypothetical protein